MTDLFMFGSPLNGHQLNRMFVGGSSPTEIPLAIRRELTGVHNAIAALPRQGDIGRLAASTDSALAPVVHSAFVGLPHRVLLDIRFWQWLTCTEFRDYTRRRWAPTADLTTGEPLPPSQEQHFLGRGSLNGIARNAMSRLFWVPEVLQDRNEDYALTQRLFSRQDLVTGLIERQFGLLTAVARAATKYLAELPEDQRRVALRRLNLRASTVALESLEEAQIVALLGVT